MFIKQKNCKICYKTGKIILNNKFRHFKIINFFVSEYNKKTSIFLKKKIGNIDFVLRKCEDCQFIWQENIPKENFLKKIYDQVIDPDESFKKSKKNFVLQKKIFNTEIIFFQKFYRKKNLNILDFGAGWGSWLLSIQEMCSNIFAIEFSSYRQKYLKKKNIKVISLKKKNIYKNYFHLVKLEQVLEHVVDLNSIILNLKSMMKKGGIISIGVPNGQNEIANGKIKIKKGPIQPLEHLNCFNNKSLKTLLEKHGFKAITIFEILLTFLRMNRIDYHSIRFTLIMIKNSLLSTRINFKKR